ncbi:PREDICTED: ATP synthase subunit f, mitochondrial isoform X2 [Crocodylus porosus]|uniref:ATP synthase subunit f, mitochondrial isoform X2 n=1 Tax=Crocodylus porosus TaxID=8502 RepID=UPI00093DAD4C|nr:PREDICTED: ATP synthase subunit f, mitochondrial isoform X2 [Crocodylus porosus]
MADKLVPLKNTRLLDVKLGQVPAWVAARDYSLSGVIGAVQREHDRWRKYH